MRDTSDEMAALAMQEAEHDDYDSLIDKLVCIFSRISDTSLVDIVLAIGEDINRATTHFKCYDVALRIRSLRLIPTEKQRGAMTNVLAYYLANL
ncbi:MAG: hypothetical protein LBP76_06630 [Treponema sp.]|jgi:hypothetical protein|nr:hypothetical protein [Treponema sp.]